MKEYLDKFHKAQAEVEAATNKFAELTAKADTLRASLTALQRSTAEVSAAKDRVLDMFIRGEATQADVDRASGTYDQAEKALRAERDLAAATERVLKQIERDIPALVNRSAVAERELWSSVSERERDMILKAVGDKVWRCFAARNLAGGAGDLQGFMVGIFGPQRLEQVQALSRDLQREILGKPE